MIAKHEISYMAKRKEGIFRFGCALLNTKGDEITLLYEEEPVAKERKGAEADAFLEEPA